jgi:ankyrin repeat protein
VLNFVRKDPEIVKILIAKGADPNAKGSEYPSLSAVAMNTDNDDVQVRIQLVNALLAGGAEVNAKDSAGYTALTSFVQMYSGELCSNLESELPLISALLAAKADPTVVNGNGDTARSLAQKQQSECDDPAGKAATAKLIKMLSGPMPGK